MKLYYSPGACSLSPHIVLREAGLDAQLEKVDLRSKKTESGKDFTAVNPRGYVPALELDEGAVLTEGPAIVQYLADRKPEKKLAAANGTLERYQLQEMLNFISTEVHKQYSPLFYPGTPPETRKAQSERLGLRYGWIQERLGNRPYLFGEQFTVADAYLFTVTNWAGTVKLDLAPFPKLQEYQQRVAARPAVQQAMREEGLLK
ncbi:MAG TPA: glutathione transferase GstA [Candidatus Binatia bacterium]|nr:glutathione transferase GstA [Candidatus Binatia bacterium]